MNDNIIEAIEAMQKALAQWGDQLEEIKKNLSVSSCEVSKESVDKK